MGNKLDKQVKSAKQQAKARDSALAKQKSRAEKLARKAEGKIVKAERALRRAEAREAKRLADVHLAAAIKAESKLKKKSAIADKVALKSVASKNSLQNAEKYAQECRNKADAAIALAKQKKEEIKTEAEKRLELEKAAKRALKKAQAKEKVMQKVQNKVEKARHRAEKIEAMLGDFVQNKKVVTPTGKRRAPKVAAKATEVQAT